MDDLAEILNLKDSWCHHKKYELKNGLSLTFNISAKSPPNETRGGLEYSGQEDFKTVIGFQF